MVLGGVKGLEWAVENDDQLKGEVSDPSKLFDIYLNTCPNQVYYLNNQTGCRQSLYGYDTVGSRESIFHKLLAIL